MQKFKMTLLLILLMIPMTLAYGEVSFEVEQKKWGCKNCKNIENFPKQTTTQCQKLYGKEIKSAGYCGCCPPI